MDRSSDPDIFSDDLSGPRRGRDPLLGELILEYRLSRLLKAGPSGRIYAARSVFSGQAVAIKVLRPGLRDSPAALSAFQREQWFLREAGSIAVPKFLGTGGFRGVPWYVMGRLEGSTLHEVLEARSRLLPAQISRLVLRVLRLTEELHAIGLSHGALSATGLIVSQDLEQLSLLDVSRARPIVHDEDILGDIVGIGALFAPLAGQADLVTQEIVCRCSSRSARWLRAADLHGELHSRLSRGHSRVSTPRFGLDSVTAVELRIGGEPLESSIAWRAASDDEVDEVTRVLAQS